MCSRPFGLGGSVQRKRAPRPFGPRGTITARRFPLAITTKVRALFKSPRYALGRFHSTRLAYAKLQHARQRLSGTRPTLHFGELYVTEARPLPVASSRLVTSSVDEQTHVANIHRDAYSSGLHLTGQAIDEIVRAARTLPLHQNSVPLGTFSELMASPDLRKRTALAAVQRSSEVPAIRAIVGDPVLVDVVANYLGYFPLRASSWLLWSLKNDLSLGERESMYQTVNFHYDVHGLHFMYVNFYLFDTDARSGAHVLIRGSHSDKRPRHLFGSAKLSEENARLDYGDDRIAIIEGRAGEGFFEDTSCYHKALPPIDGERLVLQLRYQ